MKTLTPQTRRGFKLAAVILAAGVVWLAFRAYRNPDLLLGLINLPYCN